MLGRCPDALQATDLGDHNYFAYLTVDRLDDYHARAIAEEAEIVKPPTDEPWGRREMALRDRRRVPPDAVRADRSRSGRTVDVTGTVAPGGPLNHAAPRAGWSASG
jgi:hypothetical protein